MGYPFAGSGEARIRDSVSRTLVAFIATQLVLMVLLPFVFIPPPEGLEVRFYAVGFSSSRELVVEAAAYTLILFTVAICIQRRFWLTGFLVTTPLIGFSLVLAAFWLNTGGISARDTATKSWTFFAGYAVLALILGAVFWFIAVMEPHDYERD
jgi:hypothetical protein